MPIFNHDLDIYDHARKYVCILACSLALLTFAQVSNREIFSVQYVPNEQSEQTKAAQERLEKVFYWLAEVIKKTHFE